MIRKLATLLTLAISLFITSTIAQAQIQRTFVSGTGSDANNCQRTTPCRTFQRAHDQTTAGGEVVALDSAGYGTVNISKSITISGEGVRAAITATSGNGVTINAAGATVILRELTITGNDTGNNGVLVTDAAAVYIERCVITSFTVDGIRYLTNNRLFIIDTVVRSNTGFGLNVFATAGGTARVNVDKSRFERNGGNGIGLVGGTIEASITHSIMSENGSHGFAMSSFSGLVRAQISQSTSGNNGFHGFFVGNGDELNIEYSIARGNGASGMFVIGGGTIRVSNSVSTNNQFGFQNFGGTFETRGNNTVRGNTGGDVSGPITLMPGT